MDVPLTINSISAVDILNIIILLSCVVASGLFSASETALTSLNDLKIKHLLELDRKKYSILQLWLDRPKRVLTTILIGNNFVNIFAGSFATVVANKWFGNYALAIGSGLMTVVILVFGEIVPKTYAKLHAQSIAVPLLKLLSFIMFILYPVVMLFVIMTNRLLRMMGKHHLPNEKKITEDELEFLINVGEEEGTIEEEKSKMLANVFDFGDTVIREIMVPRTSTVMLPTTATLDEIVAVINQKGHSRIPLYQDNVDNVVGMLYAKDLLRLISTCDTKTFNINQVMREPHFVPDSKKIDELFKEMKREKIHLVIVLDEYGGTAGIASMEDLIEEIVGDIQDEYDQEEESIVEANGEYLISASLNFEEFQDYFEFEKFTPINTNSNNETSKSILSDDEEDEEDEEDYDSVGGYFIAHFGSLPKIGDSLSTEDFELKVHEIEGNRIVKLLLNKKEKSNIQPPPIASIDTTTDLGMVAPNVAKVSDAN